MYEDLDHTPERAIWSAKSGYLHCPNSKTCYPILDGVRLIWLAGWTWRNMVDICFSAACC